VQFEPDRLLAYYIALAIWVIGLIIWVKVDQSMDRYALDAASQDEDAAASVGIDVTREKLKITALSAGMCAFGGAIFGQYQMYIGPDTIAGLGISLNMVFAVIAGGIWTLFGPTFGALFTQTLSEVLRILIQSDGFKSALAGLNAFLAKFSSLSINLSNALALDQAIYGLLLILFIIYMPKGIIGTLVERMSRKR
jgi:branched-chain amino acid transport system permease protein